MHKKSYTLLLVISFVGIIFLTPQDVVRAASVSWNGGYSGNLEYYTGRTLFTFDPFRGFIPISTSGWLLGLANPNINITYSAQVRNVDTNALLISGASISTGTHIKFEIAPYQDTDISWFGTGYSSDSPYGHWISGASAPVFSCSATDYVTTVYPSGVTFDVYVPLSVNPPTNAITHSGTAGLLCDASNANCTITSAGTINLTATFSPTNGKFYYRYYDYRSGGHFVAGHDQPGSFQSVGFVAGCYDNNLSMRYYEPSIPAQTISFSFTAVAANNPPAVPIVTCPATTTVNTSSNCSASATDPDGDTLRYGYDWNNDGVVDQYAPSSGYVSSGVTQSLSHTYITVGTKAIMVRAEDNRGGVSGWGPASIVVSSPVNGACGSSNLSTFSTSPTINLCNSGSATSVIGTGPWFWSCNGSNGGTNASCTAYTNVIAGALGTANGVPTATAPTSNLCSYTSAPAVVSGTGPWTWVCFGSNGGANVAGSAPKLASPIKIKYQQF